MQTVYDLPANLDKEITEYENYINEYKKGIIDKQKLRAFRVPMGIYEQRIDDTFMVRIRIPGGNITLSQFKKLIEIAKKYTNKPLHLTTREEIQLHNIELEDTVKIMKELKEAGLASRGGGGNTVRNITGSFDSGISKDEVFDITPYVIALTERMIQEQDSWTLPRKFKIAFSNSSSDTGLATVNDLGFIAKINEKGEKGFSVYLGGGMGANSNIGIKIFDFIPDKEVYNITKTAKNLFDKYGNRKNRHKARLRFVLYNLGEEEFIKKFLIEYENVKNKNYPSLNLRNFDIQNKGFIEIPIFCGDLSFDKAQKIINISKNFGEFSLRLTPRQNILIKNIPENLVEHFKKELIENNIIENTKYGFLYNAISCAGASTCRLGICLSKNLLKAIKDRFEKDKPDIENLDELKINISGCPNSCGQHLLGDIGFFGKAKKINDRYVPFYYVVAGAEIGENKTKFAEKLGEIAAYDIPDFMEKLLTLINKEKKSNWAEYYKNSGKEQILKLLENYATIPDFNINKNYYFDWYEQREFSILEKVEGECSAGLFDLIDYDFKMAEDKINRSDLKSAFIYICRALLITKGIEIKDDRDAPIWFEKKFLGNHINKKYTFLIEKYKKEQDFDIEEIKDFYNAVKDLYEKMDNSLKFPEIKKAEVKNEIRNEEIIFKDFRGVPCPLNFVKAKLVLENIKYGEKLKILLDDGEPIENVPASLRAEGHKILEQKKIENYWEVLIEKGV